MYGFHQSPGRAVETKDSNSLEAVLRELREETDLRIHQSRPKWIGYDPRFDCDVYAIELDIGENPQWTEQDKIGPWGIISWNMYINMAASRLLIPTHCTHIEMFLMEAGIISRGINVTGDDKVEELQYDPEDASAELGINEDWELRNQVTIDQRKKQLEQRLLPTGECLCGYNKSGRILHEYLWDQMELHNLA